MTDYTFYRRVLLLTVLFAVSLKCMAQQEPGPGFTYVNPKNHHVTGLIYFLGSFEPVHLDDCLFASGTFRFKIKQDGKVGKLEVTGNLPQVLINTIKKRIAETEKYWILADLPSAEDSKWYVLPVFVARQLKRDCKEDPAFDEQYQQIENLFDSDHNIIDTPTSYLLKPVYLIGVI